MTQNVSASQKEPFDGRQDSAGYGFVELNRTFHELSPDSQKDDEFDLFESLHVRGDLTWSDLLKNYRTVVLSEAGSGKTEEIRQAAEKLRGEGKPAFFLRLEHLPADFEEAFEVGTIEGFETWLKSENEGWLFLDSVDEARLKSPTDFARAIRKLSGKIKLAMQRAHIVITGRTHAWRPKTDAQLCQIQLPCGSPDKVTESSPSNDDSDCEEDEIRTRTKIRETPAFKIVALDDLNRAQIEKFAGARGVADTKGLLDDLERADAWSFAGRPQDLQEVIGFWREKGRIGTRLEIMKGSIDRRLMERTQDRLDAHSLPRIVPIVILSRDKGPNRETRPSINPLVQIMPFTSEKMRLPARWPLDICVASSPAPRTASLRSSIFEIGTRVQFSAGSI